KVLDVNSFVFFFQAEDGIRDRNVTGVQTCALPISLAETGAASAGTAAAVTDVTVLPGVGVEGVVDGRSLKVISASAAAEQADLGSELADWTSAQAQAQRTVAVVIDDGTPLAGFALSDDMK